MNMMVKPVLPAGASEREPATRVSHHYSEAALWLGILFGLSALAMFAAVGTERAIATAVCFLLSGQFFCTALILRALGK